MDWHAAVYGGRSGRDNDSGFFDVGGDDDSTTYGSLDTIADSTLRRLGGRAYFRAHEILDAHRMTDLKVREEGDILTLSARIRSTYDLTDDYLVQTRLDQSAGEVVGSSCTCQAFGRQGSVCKHVIALIMAYNENPDRFDHRTVQGARRTGTRRTSHALGAYMLREDGNIRRSYRERQLKLLREVGTRAEGQAIPSTDQKRHLPIGSVGLRPDLSDLAGGWEIRLHIGMASRGVAYLVKDIPALLRAVDQTEFVSYGRRLAFVHSRDTFDQRSLSLLGLIERAAAIRRSLAAQQDPFGRHVSRSSLGRMTLTDDEVAQLLELYLDSDLTLDYTPSERFLRQTLPARVVDGDPDLGIRISSAGSGDAGSGGYVIEHKASVERFIPGQAASFVVVRSAASSGIQDAAPLFHRCSPGFIRDRELIETLCGGQEDSRLYLGRDDLELFTRTVLPELGGPGAEPRQGRGGLRSPALTASLPPELVELRRPPCQIEFYLDRDQEGISCDLEAKYGEHRYPVFQDLPTTADAVRDLDSERLAREAVRQYFPAPQEGVARIPESDEKAIYAFLTQGLPLLRGMGHVFSTPAFDGLTVTSHTQIRVGVRLKSGLVEISPIAKEIDPDEVPELLAQYRKRRRFHRLRSGAFVDLTTLDAGQVDAVASDLGIPVATLDAGQVPVPAYQSYYLDDQVGEDERDQDFSSYLEGFKAVDPQAYRVPETLHGQLRPYQIEGFRWLNTVSDRGFGGILADEMGLGKTVQMLAYLLSRHDRTLGDSEEVLPSLIVCPASLVYNWAAEASRFAPELKVGILAGRKTDRRSMLEGSGSYDLLITSYDLLRRDIEDYQGSSFDTLVLDEAQYIKNHATKASRAVRTVDSRHRFALTGTPVENRLSELWSIFDFLMPGILGPYSHFRDRFEMPILSGDQDAQTRLQALVGPFILRRLKSQVLTDLPEKIENVITVPLEGRQRKLYAALEQELRSTLNREKDREYETGKIQVLAQLTRLRQVCCDPRLVYEALPEGGTQSETDRHGQSAKLDAIEDLVLSCQDAGRKMLIFSQFTSYLDLIAQRLRGLGVGYDMITGATSKKQRLELVDRFNQDQTPVFLISLKAGNTGLNLTGACVVVHADPWWNAAAQEQANDRAHRIGQVQDVNVYQIVAKDTIEERILGLQHTKSDLASRFVDSAAVTGASDIGRLSRRDLLALLG
ncbi:DEAD/DEAH box helicase [Bifidobacterium coryneforme]|uniref:Helicase n=1 Tax=Bifidobacterium [indicum] DSM 20214 = LMG 11587 TaxID=1341694 RepID=A0A087VSU9_9BIFI|nr:DEAD/DEAH box helicase [Bifidobacterium indicum]AIC91418.1 helicase [Bifidobacterium indicum LMG 11587 = DSM 20214]